MPGAIAPLIVGATGLSLATSTTIASVALYAGTTAASVLIQMANQPKQDIGTKLTAASGGAVAQSMIAGDKETAGSLIYAGTWGRTNKTPNTYYVRVFCLQDLPASGFKARLWASGKKTTIDYDTVNFTDVDTDYPADGSGYSGDGESMGNPVRDLDHDGNHYVWVKFLDGTQTAADPYLLSKFGVLADRPWTSTMIGRGRTIMIVTERFTVKEPNTELQMAAVIESTNFYDWRKDSTNGGSGSHRWGNYSTYEPSKNPFVIAYNIMRGIYYGGKWLYGGQNWPARRFDNDTWTAAANTCDENFSLAAGGTEKRFEVGAEIAFNEVPLTVLDRLFASANGRMVESGGIYKVYAGGIGASVYSFSDDDIVITEALTGRIFPGREDICNTITGTYIEPDNGGQAKAYKKRTKALYVANDNDEVRPKEMSFDYVRSNTRAQRLALHALNDNRRFATRSGGFPSLARKLEPGDVVNWTSSDRFGYINKKFIVGDVTLSDTGIVIPILREVDATDSDWTISDEEPYTVGIYGDIVPDTQTIDITVTPFGKKNASGKRKIPAARLNWPTDADMVDCKAVIWRYWLDDGSDDPDGSDDGGRDFDGHGRAEFAAGKGVIEGLVRSTDYWTQAKIIPYSDRQTSWCAPEMFTTGDYRVDVDDTNQNPPNIPTGLSLTTVATDFDKDGSLDPGLSFEWIAGDVDDDHPEAVEFEVQIWRSAVIGTTNSATGYSKWRTWTPSDTDILVEAKVRKYHKARVRARSAFGKLSNWSALTSIGVKPNVKTNDVATVTGVSASARPKHNRVTWTDVSNDDFRYFKVYRYIGASSTPGSAVYIGKAVDNHYNDHDPALNVGDKCWYYVTAVDTSFNESASKSTGDSCVFRPVQDDDTDTNAPNLPTSISVTTLATDIDGDGKIDPALFVTWLAGSVDGAHPASKNFSVEIWRSATLGGTYTKWKRFPSRDTDLIIEANAAKFHKVKIAAESFNGTWSDYSSLTATGVQPNAKANDVATVSGVAAAARPKHNHVTWTALTAKDFSYYKIYRYIGASSTPGSAVYVGRTGGDHWNDNNKDDTLNPGDKAWYYITAVDRTGNESASKSTGVSCIYRRVQTDDVDDGAIAEAKTDQTAPATPSAPAISQITVDIDGDGTLDTGLSVAIVNPNTGVAIKRYVVEIHRDSAASPGTYTLWKRDTVEAEDVADTLTTTYTFKANKNRLHKAKVRAVAFGGKKGSFSSLTASGVQPLGKTAAPSTPTTVTLDSYYLGGLVLWDYPSDPDYLYTEIYWNSFGSAPSGGTAPTATTTGRSFIAYVGDGGVPVYVWIRHVNRSQVKNASWVATTPTHVNTDTLTTSAIRDNAITERFQSITNSSVSCGAGTTVTVESVSISHGAGANYIDVSGYFINTSGANRNTTVTIEDGSGNVYITYQQHLIPDGALAGPYQCTIPTPSGGSTTVRLRANMVSAGTVNNTKLITNVRRR